MGVNTDMSVRPRPAGNASHQLKISHIVNQLRPAGRELVCCYRCRLMRIRNRLVGVWETTFDGAELWKPFTQYLGWSSVASLADELIRRLAGVARRRVRRHRDEGRTSRSGASSVVQCCTHGNCSLSPNRPGRCALARAARPSSWWIGSSYCTALFYVSAASVDQFLDR